QREAERADRDECDPEAQVVEGEDRPDGDAVILACQALLDHRRRARVGWRDVQVQRVDELERGPDQEQDTDGPGQPADGSHRSIASLERTHERMDPPMVANECWLR